MDTEEPEPEGLSKEEYDKLVREQNERIRKFYTTGEYQNGGLPY